ncbi:hypothetical protein [Natronobiforma cellulositropha]|uniref:hypothetical protein n=1 Tax=Natronobiforma cellulositropha TaxID=1679076 RepID=UPI0021D587FF|nr:hypothetical protein [Natronobiforma cellulositropha]
MPHQTIEWHLLEHEITGARLKQDGEVIAAVDGQATPTVPYALEGRGPSTLTFEADIEVRYERRVLQGTLEDSVIDRVAFQDTTTVSSDVSVDVYDLTASVYHAEYPDGSAGIAIYQSQPWHGYVLTEDGQARVRGVWRYYTARDTDWDTLVHASSDGTDTVASDARPVYVRAYPSEMGPRADPIRDGPVIEEVWGVESPSPAETIHENVTVDVVPESYTRSYGLAIRYDEVDRDALEVQGIVRGVSATILEPDGGGEREVRDSTLTAEVVDRTDNLATLRVELRDATTGEPIVMRHDSHDVVSRFIPIGHDTRQEYLTVGDRRLQTNSSGVATTTLTEPGSYTVEYHPGPWRTHDPAYLSARASVAWHPLASAGGWFALAFSVFWLSIPFLVALYAGLKLGSFLEFDEERYP